MVPQTDPTQQPDFPTGTPQDIGNTSQDAPPGKTGACGGTNVTHKPAPCTFSVLIEHLDPRDALALLALLDGPDNDCDLPAPWTPERSALLDWLVLVDDDLRRLTTHLRQLRRALEEIAL